MNSKYLARKNSKGGNCGLCGIFREKLQRDHIKARWKGLDDSDTNIQYLCANCHEDKTRKDISEALKGRVLSEEHKIKIGNAHRGRKHSKEHLENLTNSLRKALSTPEARLNMSMAHKGKPWSEKRRKAFEVSK